MFIIFQLIRVLDRVQSYLWISLENSFLILNISFKCSKQLPNAKRGIEIFLIDVGKQFWNNVDGQVPSGRAILPGQVWEFWLHKQTGRFAQDLKSKVRLFVLQYLCLFVCLLTFFCPDLPEVDGQLPVKRQRQYFARTVRVQVKPEIM